MMILMDHEHDFTLKAKHDFFATSHGKSPCDGIGGTIKREAANESLRVAVSDTRTTFSLGYGKHKWCDKLLCY